jgi:inosine/xanthosine triphosphatase
VSPVASGAAEAARGAAPWRELAWVRRVRVGSTNPPKLAGVRAALAAFLPALPVEGVAAASGVSEQPLGFDEITRGARQRALGARGEAGCVLGVGYEDGLVQVPDGAGGSLWMNVGCAALAHPQGVALGLSSGFAYPPACVAPAVERREPIGDVFDRFFRARRPGVERSPSALSVGNIGKLSARSLPRDEYTRHAVLCALVQLLHPDLYRAPGAGD